MNQPVTAHHNYVVDKKHVLPHGAVKLTVLRGFAWVFTECCNYILHRGEERTISTQTKPPVIRRAYTRGFAKYQVEAIV